ncbi:MAG TPA: hypothetical protein VMT29_01485 [Steroidobacteraceae bacterium]|nr:hypothetical protein [Steroidobacteraceae bacterium]
MSYRTDVNAGRSAPPNWAQQSWTEKAWIIEASDTGLGELCPDGKPARFRLKNAQPEAGAAAYTVQPDGSNPVPVPLRACKLVARGSEPLAPLNTPLPVYSPGTRPHWHDAATEVVADADSRDVLRLEGRIPIGGVEHRVRFYQVEKAVQDGTSLLVLWVNEEGSAANPDGSAVGHN